MSNFNQFCKVIENQVNSFKDHNLFIVDADKDLLWETYLKSFPKGSDPVYRERTEHDCNCCKGFIHHYGGLVQITDNKIVSIWDVDVAYPYNIVCKALSNLVHSSNIKDIFVTSEKKAGTKMSISEKHGLETFYHIFFDVDKRYLKTGSDLDTIRGNYRTNVQMIKRLMEEITIDSAQTVLELIDTNSLYRGEEHKKNVNEFLTLKKKYNKLSSSQKDVWCWSNADNKVARLRNTSIGTLLIDISNDVDLDEAVRKFESIMAPANYKRPKAIFTQKMVKDAEDLVNKLGIANSLGRRYATIDDISVNNVLFVNRDIKTKLMSSVFDELTPQNKAKDFTKVEEISIDDFVNKVLPNTNQLEVLFESKHTNNLMSLIAPKDKDSPPLFKWGNNYSWAYNGDVTDSMKELVKKAGGKVDGVLRFSLQWNDNHKNCSDFDAHCQEPAGHIFFANTKVSSGGNLDVDKRYPSTVAVENITWPKLSLMKPGQYKFYVHNYNYRGDGGFSAEIEYNGEIYRFEHQVPLRHNEIVNVATIDFNPKTGIKFIESMNSTQLSTQIWGINTNNFVKVSMVTLSPNYWDDKKIGNKHYMFVLDKCKNEGNPRGFFNEFLRSELDPNKRVFEALGSKMRVEQSDNQLSGLGFSSTKNDSVIVRVEGKTKRILKVVF